MAEQMVRDERATTEEALAVFDTAEPSRQFHDRHLARRESADGSVNDIFRRVSGDTVLGLMDLRGLATPYFFSLRRNDSLPVGGNRR